MGSCYCWKEVGGGLIQSTAATFAFERLKKIRQTSVGLDGSPAEFLTGLPLEQGWTK
jgi:hypothetical protein